MEQEAFLQKERARIAKDLHDELGASLTQISLLGKLTQQDLAEPEKARPHVEKIASLARQGVKSVDEIVWAVSPRNDTLSQLLDYAGQYAVDFLNAAGIRCRIDFPEKIPARELHRRHPPRAVHGGQGGAEQRRETFRRDGNFVGRPTGGKFIAPDRGGQRPRIFGGTGK